MSSQICTNRFNHLYGGNITCKRPTLPRWGAGKPKCIRTTIAAQLTRKIRQLRTFDIVTCPTLCQNVNMKNVGPPLVGIDSPSAPCTVGQLGGEFGWQVCTRLGHVRPIYKNLFNSNESIISPGWVMSASVRS